VIDASGRQWGRPTRLARSFLHNQEVNAVVLGTEFGDRMRAAFARDVAPVGTDYARAMAAAVPSVCSSRRGSHASGSTGCSHEKRRSRRRCRHRDLWGAPDQGWGACRSARGRIVNLAGAVCALPNPDREMAAGRSRLPMTAFRTWPWSALASWMQVAWADAASESHFSLATA